MRAAKASIEQVLSAASAIVLALIEGDAKRKLSELASAHRDLQKVVQVIPDLEKARDKYIAHMKKHGRRIVNLMQEMMNICTAVQKLWTRRA